jgi:hypothetical protein
MAALEPEKVAVQAQNMRGKPCRMASTDGHPALDVFRQQDGGGDTTVGSTPRWRLVTRLLAPRKTLL